MIQPQPYKLKCPKCGFSKTVHPKSDVIDPRDLFAMCPKCNEMMKKEELSSISKKISDIFK